MIVVKQSAVDKLEAQFSRRKDSPVRISRVGGGGMAPMLSLSFDKPGDNDASIEAGGFTFVADKVLLEKTGQVVVDADASGFTVRSERSLGAGDCPCCG